MRTVGVVAEYDPFHRGHARHLAEAKRLSGADCALVVMSGFFTQRGAPACLSPFERAACALAGGADLVLLLPAVWSLRSAEGFALGAVRILQGIGAEAVSFGAENPDLALLKRAAGLPDLPAVRAGLRDGLDKGLGWAEAMTRSAEAEDPEAAALLRLPNCTLGAAYLRAMKRLGYAPEVFPVPRLGSHGTGGPPGEFASGAAVREAVARGDLETVRRETPPQTAERLEARIRAGWIGPDALEQALLARLRTMEDADFAALPECSEGLDRALRRAGREAGSLAELEERLSGRRYPRARIRRLCASALLGLREEDGDALPDGALVLGVRRGREALLSRGAPDFRLAVRSRDYPAQAPWFRAERRAADLWALAAGLPAGLLERSALVKEGPGNGILNG